MLLTHSTRCGVACVALAGLALSAHAQPPYKVIGPDGRVTYTDRPSTSAVDSRVSPLAAAAPAPAEVSLPLELRQATGRFPVTLYVTTDDCAPCTSARQLLRQRGVPFAERQVQTPDDVLALERLSGGRDAPTVGIGGQVLRGLTPELWNSYLDAAGYPRESRLPANYQYPAPTPLVARAAPQPAAPAAPAELPADLPVTLPSLPASTGPIRF